MVAKTISKSVSRKTDRGSDAATLKKFWKNEFPLLNETLKWQETPKQRVGAVVKEYARYCTLHGIQYVFKENSTFVERLVWFAIVLTSFACASLLVNTMWTRFSTSPTMTAVKDTHLPLYSLPFPAISVCSADKIKRDEAYAYLSEYVDLSNDEELQEVNNFLSAMSLFQLPLYSRMSVYLQNADSILPSLAHVNLTDFMIKVMPTCDEVFNKCFWIGKSTNCCEIFNLQRTEEGFCYSFNSLTSHFDENCNKIGDIGSYSEFSSIKSCPLRRNAAAGSSSGLEIFLKSFNVSNRIINATDIVGIPGYKVQVFYVSEYPEAGMGNLVESKQGIKLVLTIKPYVTISTQTIRKLDINDRFCYFPDEQKLSVSSSYSQKSCLIECRLGHLKKVCNCRPFFFNTKDNSVPVCNATQIHCIAEHNSELVFFSPPSVDIRGFNDSDLTSLLNCSQCLPTCHESIYDIDTAFSEDTLPLARESYGGLDIFYRNEGAVKYQRDVTFGWEDLLVSFGGIAGLFLGFSLLSIVEFVYWSIKLTAHQISTYIHSRTIMIKSLKPR